MVDRPAARHRPRPGAGRPAAACGSRTWWRPTCTTTTSPAGWRWPATGAGYLVPPPTGRVRPAAGGRRRRRRGRSRCGCGWWPRPGTRSTTCPTCCTDASGPVGGVHRRVAAVRRHRPHRPARPRAHPRRWPCPARLRAPAGRRAARRHRGVAHPRVRQLLLGRPSPTRRPPPSAGAGRSTRRCGWTSDASSPRLLAGLDAYPAYYAHMGPATPPARPGRPDPARRADAAELRAPDRRRGVGGGPAFAQGVRPRQHLTGTLSFGLDGRFPPGWAGYPVGRPDHPARGDAEQVAAAQRELARIGIDRPAAAATGTPQQLAGGDASRLGDADHRPPSSTWPPPATAVPHGLPAPDVVLDVRMGNEWRAGHVDGAVHIPLPDLPHRLDAVPDGVVWVHCGSGYRAAAATQPPRPRRPPRRAHRRRLREGR